MRRDFELEVGDAKESINDLSSIHRKLGNVKLISLAFIILFAVLLFRDFNLLLFSNLMMLLLGLVFIQVFILLAIIQVKTEKKLVDSKIKLKTHEDYLARVDGVWGDFADTGEEFVDKNHKYTGDLDIFGANSVFQYLNTTKTWHGRQQFAKDLSQADFNAEEIRGRQKAVWELSPTHSFSSEFQLHGSKIRFKGEINELISLLKGDGEAPKISKVYRYLLILPVFSTIFMLTVFFLQLSELFVPAALLFITHICFWILCVVKFSGEIGKITGAGYRIGEYSPLFHMIERRGFESATLKAIKAKIKSDNGVVASEAIAELDRLIMLIDFRRSGMVWFVLNLFFLWDFICVYLLKRWRAGYRDYVEGWFEAIGDMESLLSFANLGLVESNSCLPMIVSENLIEGTDLGHPLINSEKRINNDVKLDNEIFIISGSNMSGKTTFLRTMGTNIVLGLAGGFVCAKGLKMPVISVSTSMRVADNLSEGVSTFYAELERIKGIIDECKGEQTIFLIDEMFRGTNSKDRLEGARTVIKSLEEQGAIGLVTTHDLELCNLADNGRISNYSFSETYEDNEIVFDYKLRQGKSDSTNARFLMNKLGIVEAEELSEESE